MKDGIIGVFAVGLLCGAAVTASALTLMFAGQAARDSSVACKPAPGEISHQDSEGLCVITRKGRIVTRYQT